MTESDIMGFVEGVSRGRLHGWAFDPHHPGRRLTVAIDLPNGQTCTVLADRYRADLQRHGYGDGHYGFSFPAFPDVGAQIAAHVISQGDAIPLQRAAAATSGTESAIAQTFHAATGRLHIDDPACRDHVSGWARHDTQPESRVTIQIKLDGKVVQMRRATLFRPELVSTSCDGFHGFVIPLPVHSPSAICEVIAFGDAFELR
jgi:hypothetical protein